MARMTRPRIKKIEPLPDFLLRIRFANESVYTVDFKLLLDESPGLAPMLWNQEAFANAVVDEWGWMVEWPELDIQIGADTLWLDAQAQNAADDNTRIFCQWRARYGLSLADAAKALGMTTRTMSAYGSGKHPVPRYIALACKGWDCEHRGHSHHQG